MDFTIKDESGFFNRYVKTFLKENVYKHINSRKEIIYLPKDTALAVAEKGMESLKNQVDTISIGLSKNLSYCYNVKYKNKKD